MPELTEERVREIARDEIASQAGLVLRRLQDMSPWRAPWRNQMVSMMNEIYGEVLRDFSSTPAEPGE